MRIKSLFFFSLGATFLGLGAVGVFLPLLPTTPLVIASFFCFAKSSKRAERWISNNRYFGSYIENYKTKEGVPLDVKLKSIVFLWACLTVSIIVFNQYYLLILLIIIGVVVTAHILLLKSKI
ncbi:MAG: YbaN family protein [Methanobacterium sp.]|uniref:YbaN family protein n=1 Tax=Methanobacterium sp. TaxID=2164 RepID=UPI003D6473AC|nr:YbaN family protein [Methanobacterium sp.]